MKDIELDQTTCSQRASTCLALKIDPGFSAPEPDLWHNAHGKLNIPGVDPSGDTWRLAGKLVRLSFAG